MVKKTAAKAAAGAKAPAAPAAAAGGVNRAAKKTIKVRAAAAEATAPLPQVPEDLVGMRVKEADFPHPKGAKHTKLRKELLLTRRQYLRRQLQHFPREVSTPELMRVARETMVASCSCKFRFTQEAQQMLTFLVHTWPGDALHAANLVRIGNGVPKLNGACLLMGLSMTQAYTQVDYPGGDPLLEAYPTEMTKTRVELGLEKEEERADIKAMDEEEKELIKKERAAEKAVAKQAAKTKAAEKKAAEQQAKGQLEQQEQQDSQMGKEKEEEEEEDEVEDPDRGLVGTPAVLARALRSPLKKHYKRSRNRMAAFARQSRLRAAEKRRMKKAGEQRLLPPKDLMYRGKVEGAISPRIPSTRRPKDPTDAR